MALKVGELYATIGLKDKGFSSGLSGAGKKLSGLGSKLASIGKKITIGVGLPLAAVGAKSFQMAADMTESINKVDTVFGESSKTIQDWAKTTLGSIGIAQPDALEMVSLFGDMGTGMGQSTDEAAKMSKELVNLAGDLSSFKNISAERAQSALAGIYTGETESLKGLGIIMNQANLESFAMSKGIKKSVKEMTEAEKVQLRYQYVMDATANAQGDFAKTSDSASNQIRQFKGAIKEIGVAIGQRLLPIITPIIQKITEIAKSMSSADKTGGGFSRTLDLIVGALVPLMSIIGTVFKIFGQLASVLAQKLMPIVTPMINGIAEFANKFQEVSVNTEAFGKILDWLITVLTPIAKAMWTIIKIFGEFISNIVKTLIPILAPIFKWLMEAISKIATWFNKLSGTTKKWMVAIGLLTAIFGPLGAIIGIIIGIGVALYKNWDTIKAKAMELVNKLVAIWNRIKESFRIMADYIRNTWNNVVSVVGQVASKIFNLITSPFRRAWNFIKGIFNNIKTGLANAFKFRIPKIKLPHIKIRGKLSLKPPSVPKIGISWYKNGGMFNSPTLAGIGEAGKEAVVPFSGLTSRRIGQELAALAMKNSGDSAAQQQVIYNNEFVISGYDKDKRELAEEISRIQYKISREKNRARGR